MPRMGQRHEQQQQQHRPACSPALLYGCIFASCLQAPAAPVPVMPAEWLAPAPCSLGVVWVCGPLFPLGLWPPVHHHLAVSI